MLKDMKKIVWIATLLLTLGMLAGCKKADPKTAKPTWSSPTLKNVELGEKVDGKVTASVPAGIESLIVTLTTIPDDLRGIVNQYVESSNRGTKSKPIKLDLINDKTLESSAIAKFFSPIGVNLSGAKSATMDLAGFLMQMMQFLDMATGTSFTMDISLTDQEENQIAQTASFRWTAGPEITSSNDPLTTMTFGSAMPDFELYVQAEGGLKALTLTFEGENGKDPLKGIVEHIKKYTKDKTAVLDLINDTGIAGPLSLPTADKLKGKKNQITISLATLMQNLVVQSEDATGSFVLRVDAEDELGKTGSYKMIFKKS